MSQFPAYSLSVNNLEVKKKIFISDKVISIIKDKGNTSLSPLLQVTDFHEHHLEYLPTYSWEASVAFSW